MTGKIQLYTLQEVCFAHVCTNANFPVPLLVQPLCHRRLLSGQHKSSHCPEELSRVVYCWVSLTGRDIFALVGNAWAPELVKTAWFQNLQPSNYISYALPHSKQLRYEAVMQQGIALCHGAVPT